MAEKTCPECKSNRVHRSHARNLWEKVQKRFTTRRLFRCHDCGWRGWLETGRAQPVISRVDSMRLGPMMLIVAVAIGIGVLIVMGVMFRK